MMCICIAEENRHNEIIMRMNIFDHLFLQVIKPTKEDKLAFIALNFIVGIPRFSPQMVCIMCFQMCPQIPCIRGCKATLVTSV